MDDLSDFIDIILENFKSFMFILLIIPLLFTFFLLLKQIALQTSIDDIEFFESLLIILILGMPPITFIAYIIKKLKYQ